MAHTIIGTVTSTKMDKTITVENVRKLRHPRYKKIVTATKKLKAHNEDPSIVVGSVVEITSCRPISRTKSFRVTKKIS